MDSLNFGNNWRRSLLLTKQSTRDIDMPVTYVVLANKVLAQSFNSFCEKYSYEYDFDYDVKNGVLWPANDATSSQELVDSLNALIPKCASTIKKAPAEIHNLNFNIFDDLSF